MYQHLESTHNLSAARIVLPKVKDLYPFNSLLDIGCGIGTWLKVAQELEVEEIYGVDGDYVDRELLGQFIDESNFLAFDLKQALNLDRKFDLVICLEVAEHLPPQSSDVLIETLCVHSNTILFSAAIPFQGGQNHLNEKPPEYWTNKFKEQGYHVYDPIRPLVWESPDVDVWYKQNMFLFSKNKLDLPLPIYTHIIHPELFEAHQIKNIQYQNELKKLKGGQGNPLFYLKKFFQSIFNSKS